MPMLPGTSKMSQQQAMEILKKKLLGLGAVRYLKDYFSKLAPPSEKKGGTVSNIKKYKTNTESHKKRLEDAMRGDF